ncbi:MAG: hypothetical protein HUU46_22160 [Candidatus Hydrogenedentes bacterium]|nr:hypothetical protein [Candidatus Hydrogenedentota bacterium]
MRTQQYAPAALTEKHKELLRKIALGARQCDAARELGITTRHASSIRNSPLGRAYLQELMDSRDATARNIGAQLADLLPRAVEVVGQVLDGQLGGSMAAQMQFRAAESVLSRFGYPVTKQIAVDAPHSNIEHIRRLAAEMNTNSNPNILPFLQVVDSETSGACGMQAALKSEEVPA